MPKFCYDGDWFTWIRKNGEIEFTAYPNHYLQRHHYRTKVTFQKDLAHQLELLFGKNTKDVEYKENGNRVTIVGPYKGSALQERDRAQMWRSRLYARRPMIQRRSHGSE